MEDTVSFALARAGMAHRARAHQLLAEVGLHPGQEFLLRILWREGGATPGELAERLGVEPATVTKSLRRLESAGLVERGPDPDDGRRVRVTLTAAGRDLESRTREVWDQLEANTVAGLTHTQAETLRTLLAKVRDGLGGGRC